ncbi:unnamed protein product [Larinioides sclopetarius]
MMTLKSSRENRLFNSSSKQKQEYDFFKHSQLLRAWICKTQFSINT